MAALPGPVRVPRQRSLASCVTSVTSVANDKDDNEINPRAVRRSPGICLTAEENPGKPQQGDRLMKELCDVIASNGVPFLQMRSVGSHSMSGREVEGKKERTYCLICRLHSDTVIFCLILHVTSVSERGVAIVLQIFSRSKNMTLKTCT